MAFVFRLASIRNMRSGGMGTPACCVSFSMAATRCGCSLLSGSNLLNSGSITTGVITISPRRIKTAGNQSLNPLLVADIFRDVSKLRRPAQPKDQKKEKSAKKIRNEVKRVARPRVRYRLRLALMRKRVLSVFCLLSSLRFRRPSLRRAGSLRRALRGRRLRMRGRRWVQGAARRHRETQTRAKDQHETAKGDPPSHQYTLPISQRHSPCGSGQGQHGPRVCRTVIPSERFHPVELDGVNEVAFPICGPRAATQWSMDVPFSGSNCAPRPTSPIRNALSRSSVPVCDGRNDEINTTPRSKHRFPPPRSLQTPRDCPRSHS